jgi:hypothetical protein
MLSWAASAAGRAILRQGGKLSAALEAWSKRQKESGHGGLPNLGFGGTLVAVFVTSYFAAQIGDALLVCIYYGPRAFFVQGLRVTDWKHGLLSNGAPIPFTGLMTFVWWIPLIALTEMAAAVLRLFLLDKPRWVSTMMRVAGGFALMAFSARLYWDGSHPFHPIPLSSLIAGVMLLRSVIRSRHLGSSA